jgi:hypothetical protein
MPKRDTHTYCAVTATVTLCVIDPEVAVIVRFDAPDVGAVVMLDGDCCDEEQPAIPAKVTKNSSAKNDPRARTERRFRPANDSNPIGPIKERLTPAGEWKKPAGRWFADRL